MNSLMLKEEILRRFLNSGANSLLGILYWETERKGRAAGVITVVPGAAE